MLVILLLRSGGYMSLFQLVFLLTGVLFGVDMHPCEWNWQYRLPLRVVSHIFLCMFHSCSTRLGITLVCSMLWLCSLLHAVDARVWGIGSMPQPIHALYGLHVCTKVPLHLEFPYSIHCQHLTIFLSLNQAGKVSLVKYPFQDMI